MARSIPNTWQVLSRIFGCIHTVPQRSAAAPHLFPAEEQSEQNATCQSATEEILGTFTFGHLAGSLPLAAAWHLGPTSSTVTCVACGPLVLGPFVDSGSWLAAKIHCSLIPMDCKWLKHCNHLCNHCKPRFDFLIPAKESIEKMKTNTPTIIHI